ncbi:S1 family peptidase [Streptomyces rimosus]|uniref:S1 family peptidase n=1 Tax=Streptomyces rimosus TaxID=1927 RepID=UPI000AA52C4E|nr:S1 family peptidase [Streptomyces rimosus]
MKRPTKTALTLGTAGIALVATMAPAANAAPASPHARYTEAQIAGMTPGKQEKLLAPLRAIADAADRAGSGSQADIYAGVRIDAPRETVHVYLTDLSRAAKFIKAASALDRRIDTGKITIVKAGHTRQEMHEVRDRLLAQEKAGKLPYKIHTVAVAADASTLEVAVDKPDVAAKTSAAARRNPDGRSLAPATDVPVAFKQGQRISPAARTWADVRWKDGTPFIAGDVLTDGSQYCSAGLPAVRKSDNKPVMVTAAHCFANGLKIYTGSGTTPTFGKFYDGLNGQLGNYAGTVNGVSTNWDAEQLIGTDNNADVSETTGYKPVTGVAYSHNGDFVCQNGAASFFMKQETVCGIKVVNDDITYTLDTGWKVRGVEGTRLPGNPWTVAHGDSGSMVYTSNGSARQARGIVSALASPYQTNAGSYMYWTEATDIFNHFGLKLNPKT